MLPRMPSSDNESRSITSHTAIITAEEAAKLQEWGKQRLWPEREVDYADWSFIGPNLNMTYYPKKGKLLLQGKGTADFIRDVLEPEITKVVSFGYEKVLNPEWFEWHAGMDESGKGDIFGPLVTATVIAGGEIVEKWVDGGIGDSKKLTDQKIFDWEKKIRKEKDIVIDFQNARVWDHSALEAIDALAVKYQEAGKKLHLVHLSRDCKLLLKKAKDMVEINTIEDPHYGVVVDYAEEIEGPAKA